LHNKCHHLVELGYQGSALLILQLTLKFHPLTVLFAAVYPRLFKFHYFNILSTGQKSHYVIINKNCRNALF